MWGNPWGSSGCDCVDGRNLKEAWCLFRTRLFCLAYKTHYKGIVLPQMHILSSFTHPHVFLKPVRVSFYFFLYNENKCQARFSREDFQRMMTFSLLLAQSYHMTLKDLEYNACDLQTFLWCFCFFEFEFDSPCSPYTWKRTMWMYFDIFQSTFWIPKKTATIQMFVVSKFFLINKKWL